MKHKSEKKFLKNSHSLRTTGNASWVSYTLLGRRKLYSREVVRESKTTIVTYLQHFQRIITKNITREICTVNYSASLFFFWAAFVSLHSVEERMWLSGEQVTYLRSRRLRQTIDLRHTEKPRYFAITEFNKCFIIRSPSLFLINKLMDWKRSAIFTHE